MNASILDLRYRMKDVLGAIDRGETVTVLYRGKVKAKLMPVVASSGTSGTRTARTQDQPLFGLWKDREDLADPAAYIRNLRRNRSAARSSGSSSRGSAKKLR